MDSDLHQVPREFSGLVSADENAIARAYQRNLDMAAKAQRRADLVTLTAAALPVAANIAQQFHHVGGPEFPQSAAHHAVVLAEAALAEIERRVK